MLKGFKDFIMRGNLIELAVAFIVGGAFASVVTTFTNVLMSFISKIGGQPDFGSVSIADVNVEIPQRPDRVPHRVGRHLLLRGDALQQAAVADGAG
jgi:large conductance mechanosensitive channel protein